MENDPFVVFIEQKSWLYELMGECLVADAWWTQLLKVYPCLSEQVRRGWGYFLYVAFELEIKLPTESLHRHVSLLVSKTHAELDQRRAIDVLRQPEILLVVRFCLIVKLFIVLLDWGELRVLGW